MTLIGTKTNPLRVAIIGSGPAGFYTAEALFKQKDVVVEIDMFDRLPTPFGLVRDGVAPDHQKIKSVTKVYDRIAQNPNYRFYGYVEFGSDMTVADLRAHYHQIVYATGAATDRHLNIPGENLKNSCTATEFIAWYNGHPDYRDYQFDLSQERVAVIGVGNVAVDVARILCRTPEELAKTDIADYALEALRHSKVKEVYMLGRRGPAQAAFSNPELKELNELAGANLNILTEEVTLDSLSQQDLENNGDKATRKKVELLQAYAKNNTTDKDRRLTIRFLTSPVEIAANEVGEISHLRLVKNELYMTENGSLRPRATDQFEDLPVGLVFRSVGYRGVALPEVPFYDKWGVISNEQGRVMDFEAGTPVVGEYTAGWIKRGPSGVIGTNKADAIETVNCMLADLQAGKILSPKHPSVQAAAQLVTSRQPNYFSYEDWLELDRQERLRGQEQGRPRVKFTDIDAMIDAVQQMPIELTRDEQISELMAA